MNRATGLRVSVLALALFAALGSSPSVNTAAKSDIDRRLAAMQPQPRDIPAAAVAEPLPLAVGQWATYKMLDDENKPTISTFKIVAEQDGAVWYEVASDSYYGHSATKMLVYFGDRRDPATFDIRQIMTKDDKGNVTTVPPEMISMMRGTYASALQNVVVSWTQYPQEDVQVLAGRFTGAYRGRSTVSFATYSATSDVWYHPAVPIVSTVKSVGVDKPSSMELVDFGTSGATSEF